ncbi:MAG: NAD(+)/NADH kinase, partial [Planctomycetales bacterium]|nr:NAD(+)/NADH kinase [Planctomycetales bacterium]
MKTEAIWPALGRARPRVAVLASVNRPRVRAELQKLEAILARSADIVAIDQDESFDFAQTEVDLCVVLGGDGSILSAARRMGLHQKPVIGVNLGRLGFLAALGEEELGAIWPEVCAGKYPIDEHLMLQCAIVRAAQRQGGTPAGELPPSQLAYQLA